MSVRAIPGARARTQPARVTPMNRKTMPVSGLPGPGGAYRLFRALLASLIE